MGGLNFDFSYLFLLSKTMISNAVMDQIDKDMIAILLDKQARGYAISRRELEMRATVFLACRANARELVK